MSPVQKGGLAGAAVGAGVGGALGASAGVLNAGEGALVGAATGGLVGAVGADAYAGRKTAKDQDALKAQIENLKNQGDAKDRRIDDLEGQVDGLEDKLDRQPKEAKPPDDEVSQAPAPTGDEEVRDLQQAVGAEVEVGRTEKGITLTFVSEVLFSSGKATLTKSGVETLHKASEIVRERYPNNEINIEGHTDNVPIKYSGYRSNWELSTDRATTVLHFLIDQESFRAELLSVTGYGETRPVAPNDAALGRRLNRRAIIVILPDIKYEKQHLSL